MKTKLSQITEAAAANDWTKALRIAAKFQDLGDQRAAIVRGHEASHSPGFYKQIGKDPDALIAQGIEALKVRYRLH